jgi:hypothetical protein
LVSKTAIHPDISRSQGKQDLLRLVPTRIHAMMRLTHDFFGFDLPDFKAARA